METDAPLLPAVRRAYFIYDQFCYLFVTHFVCSNANLNGFMICILKNWLG